jgi:hypothetical protein
MYRLPLVDIGRGPEVSMATVSKGSAIGSEGTEWPRVLRGGGGLWKV